MKVQELVEIIRKEVRKAVREEMRSLISEGFTPIKAGSSMKESLKESFIKDKPKIVKNIPKPKFTNPLDELMYETQVDLMSRQPEPESEYDGVQFDQYGDILQNVNNTMAAKFNMEQPVNEMVSSIQQIPQAAPSRATVKDMFKSTQVLSGGLMAEGIPDASRVGEIAVVPDFTKMMGALKAKGAI